MMRHPPHAVPTAIAKAQLATTQKGIWKPGAVPSRTNDMVITPIDFWASLVPWLSASASEEKICRRLNVLFMSGEAFREKKIVTRSTINPKIKPRNGEMIKEATTNRTPLTMILSAPCAIRTAPIIPPTKACEELEGRPYHHVSRFQMMAPETA